MWEERMITDCLKEQYNIDLGEEEMLGDLEEDGRISIRLCKRL
jgi:hypothetical protein